MNVARLFCLALVTTVFTPGLQAGNEIDTAREAVYPALVNIAVVGTQYQQGRLRRFPAAGSGVIVSPEGHVLTNYHVAGETTRITCTLPDGRTFEAQPIVLDPLTDSGTEIALRTDDGATRRIMLDIVLRRIGRDQHNSAAYHP